MSEEKPLHVRVAEALGCKLYEQRRLHPEYPHKIMGPIIGWFCHCPERAHGEPDEDCDAFGEVLRYDTDWSATGPIIEKYGIGLRRQYLVNLDDFFWTAVARNSELYLDAVHPLIAVCNLILALKEAGKLDLPTGR